LIVLGEFIEQLDVASEGSAYVDALEQIVTEQRLLGEAA
jgi:hypothetical protein